MRAFEFPPHAATPAAPVKGKSDKPEARAPGGGFFGGFSKNSKSKKATLSKAAAAEKEQKMKQYRDIIGANTTEADRPTSNKGVKRTAAANEWVVE